MKNKRMAAQYFCAILLIVSSIIMAFSEALYNHDIASGILLYIAQAFLLAASIFGLDYYVRKLSEYVSDKQKFQSSRTD